MNVLWLKGCECILTENIQKGRERKAANDHKLKSVNGSWPKGCEINLDWKGRNRSWPWPKGCKWVMTERVQMTVTERLRMDGDRKIANMSWPKSANGRYPKVVNGLWPKKCKRVMTKKGCERIVIERMWTICYRKSVNGSWLKRCERVVTKGVSLSMDHDQRGKNGSLLKMCERNITKRMLKVNHDVGDIRVWSFLANIKSLFKTTTNINEVLIYRWVKQKQKRHKFSSQY